MKILYHTHLLLWMLLLIQGAAPVQAQQVKVFSQYNYYTTEKEVTIIGELTGPLLPGEYALLVSNGNQVIAVSHTLSNNLLSVQFPLAPLAIGKTALQYTATHQNKIIGKGMVDITRLQPKANEVKINRQTGGLIVDGLPFFPFGFYCNYPGRLAEQEVTHGFNLIAPYQVDFVDSFPAHKAYMDRCAQLGVRVQYSVNSLIGSGHNGAKGLDMSDADKEELLKKNIIAFRDHPALLSWYMNDEPDGQGRPPALLEKAYQLIHELDPYHPISVVFMIPEQFNWFRNTMDIAMTDPYPIPGPMNTVERYVKQLNHDFQHEKSVWLVPQAFGGQEMWNREPTAREIRLMTYIGLMNGVKGIQYYTHALGNLNPQSVSAWSVCSDMAVEVSQMAAFLLSAEISPPVSSSDSMVLTRSFTHNGDLLIMAVNKENKPKTIKIWLNNPPNEWVGSTTASLWFENREVAFSNGSMEDMIDAMGTRVYLIKAKNVTALSKTYAGNLTVNPGFEQVVSPGLPIGSNTKKSFPEKGDPGASFFADPRQSIDGLFSLRLTTPVDSGGDKIRLLPIVIQAGNSYSVSIWAKAKAQDKMPVFRLMVDKPKLEKLFTLTTEWQRYSFMFHADSSWSGDIFSLDLLTAGTAWFDLVQVNPDPVISYTIGKDQVARVSIDKTTPGAVLKYWIGTTDTTKMGYKQPFLVNKAAIVQAGLFVDEKQVAQAGLFIPVNKALGKNVTFQTPYAPQYAASGDASLTDGLLGSTAFKDHKWLGFLGRDVVATIDMEQATTIRSVTVNFLCDPIDGIHLPVKISLYISGNGKDFQLVDSTINTKGTLRGEAYLQSFVLNGKQTKARYIRVVAETVGDIPDGYLFKGTKSWIFTDEVLVE